MKSLFAGALVFLLSVVSAAAQKAPASSPAPPASAPSSLADLYTQTDPARRAEAYYQFSLGHLFEQEYESSSRSELANQAIEAYKKAEELDPGSPAIAERLAEIYAKSQRIRDAVLQAQQVLARDPDNLNAHRLLARIYVRTLGDADHPDAQKDTLGKAVEQLEAVLRLEPDDFESAIWLARLYRFRNEHDKAEKVLRDVLHADPENDDAVEQLGRLLLDENKVPETIALLEPAADEADSPTLWSLLGEAYLQHEEPAKAEQAYQRAVELTPDDVVPRHGLAQSLSEQNKFAPALEQYQRLAELEPEESENYLRMSQLYRRLDQLDKADSALAKAKQLAPGNLEVIFNEALLDDAEGHSDDAIRVIADAIARLKADPQAESTNARALSILYEQLGRLYRETEKYPEAIQSFEALGELRGANGKRQARLLIIDTYREARELDRAIAEVKKAMAEAPDDRTYQITYAMLLGENNQTDAAAKVLNGLIQSGADSQDINLDLAQIYERGQRYAEAEQAALAAEKSATTPAEQVNVWFLLGAIYERQKRYDQAEEEFKKALAVDPRNSQVLNYYGYMLADRGVRLEEAVSLVQQAVEQESNNGAYLDSLGWAYFKQNKFAQAEDYLRKAVSRLGHDPTILEHLGEVYAKTGRPERAAATWEKALEEWRHAVPADYEPAKVEELQHKLTTLKRSLAQKSGSGEVKPQ